MTPSGFLGTLRERGLPVADTLPVRDPDVAAQMLTQSKQLGLNLDSTLAKFDPATLTALHFTALLPLDSVPWPWLRALTVARHPELEETDDLGADPWLTVQRRLSGLRLLTSGDQPEIARIHRLVAAHVGHVSNVPDSSVVPKFSVSEHVGNVLHNELIAFIRQRADQIYWSQAAPQPWELDALLVALPILLDSALSPKLLRDVSNDAVFLSEKVGIYRNVPAAVSLVQSCHSVMQRLAESDPANAAWQRDLVVSHHKLAFFARQSGDEEGFVNELRECYLILHRMKQFRQHLDPPIEQLYQQLTKAFGNDTTLQLLFRSVPKLQNAIQF